MLRRKRMLVASAVVPVLFGGLLTAAVPANQNAAAIVKRSVEVNNADWRALPRYSHEERDVNAKLNSNGKVASKQEKTEEVLMIDGSPYEKLIAINGEPLSAAEKKRQEDKLKAEIARRKSESPGARQSRIDKYQRERAEEHLLMSEMVRAFNFKLVGEESVDGHHCFVLDAKPNPDYKPAVSKARVLTGMMGRLWIDKDSYHWVKVKAHVVKPVEFGLFVAKVRPGTEFELDQKPIEDGHVWMPCHFSQSVNARVLGVYGIRTSDEEFYSKYEPAQGVRPAGKTGGTRSLVSGR